MKNLLPLAILTFGVLQFSCSKEGPAGPQGATGAQGPTGAAGPAGTANIIYSSWFLTGAPGSPGWDTLNYAGNYLAYATYDKAAAGVTQSIIDNGIVLAYMKGDPTTNLGNEVFPLPYTIGPGFAFTDYWGFVLNEPGNIRFLYKADYPWLPAQLGGISFRYVIVPGGVVTGRMRDPRKMTYDEVCEAYGIPK